MAGLLKIGICGAHGTGKSTLALKLASEHKAEHPYMRVGIVTEVARSCPWGIAGVPDPEAQRWIFHQQFIRELEEGRRNNVIICDRTVLDAAVYSAANGMEYLAELWRPAIENWWRSYDTVFFLSPREAIADDGVRRLEREYQAKIHTYFEKLIREWQLHVVRFSQSEGGKIC